MADALRKLTRLKLCEQAISAAVTTAGSSPLEKSSDRRYPAHSWPEIARKRQMHTSPRNIHRALPGPRKQPRLRRADVSAMLAQSDRRRLQVLQETAGSHSQTALPIHHCGRPPNGGANGGGCGDENANVANATQHASAENQQHHGASRSLQSPPAEQSMQIAARKATADIRQKLAL